jgi:hypothetical protein
MPAHDLAAVQIAGAMLLRYQPLMAWNFGVVAMEKNSRYFAESRMPNLKNPPAGSFEVRDQSFVMEGSRYSYSESRMPNSKDPPGGSFEEHGQNSVVAEKMSMVEEEERQLGKLQTRLGLDRRLDLVTNENPKFVRRANDIELLKHTWEGDCRRIRRSCCNVRSTEVCF